MFYVANTFRYRQKGSLTSFVYDKAMITGFYIYSECYLIRKEKTGGKTLEMFENECVKKCLTSCLFFICMITLDHQLTKNQYKTSSFESYQQVLTIFMPGFPWQDVISIIH